MAAQTTEMNAANVACLGDVGVDGIDCGVRLPLKIATSNAPRIRTAIELTAKICIEESAEKYDTAMTDENRR
jgi:hypothetical protein